MVKTARQWILLCRLLGAVLFASAQAFSSETTTFKFEGVPSNALAGTSFPITVRAVDSAGNVSTDFSEEVPIRAQIFSTPTAVFSEIDFQECVIELVNPGSVPLDLSGWELQLNLSSFGTAEGVLVHFDFPAGTLLAGEETMVLAGRELPDVPNQILVKEFRRGDELRRAQRLELRNRAGEIVDQLFTSSLSSADEPLWIGLPPKRGGIHGWCLHRVGTYNHFTALNWKGDVAGYGEPHPELRLPWMEAALNQALFPAVVKFTNGVWSGEVSLPTVHDSVVLRVFGPEGQMGSSEPLAVRHIAADPAQAGEAPSALILSPGDMHVVEGAGFHRLPSTVFLSHPADEDTTVQLSADDPLRVPTELIIPRGALSAKFYPHAGEDEVYHGTNQVRVTATAEGWLTAEHRWMVTDNENGGLQIAAPLHVAENEPTPVELIFFAPRPYDLSIEVGSDSPERLEVPSIVILPAGETNVSFTVLVPNNDVQDSGSLARVYLSTAEGSYKEFFLNLLDDEVIVEKLEVGWVGPAQLTGRPIPVQVQVTDLHGSVQRTNMVGELLLIDPGHALSFEPIPVFFTNGVWSDEIVIDTAATQVHFEIKAAGLSAPSVAFDVFSGATLPINPLHAVWDSHTETFLVSEGPATNETGRLLAVNPATGELVHSLPLPRPATRIALSEDGSTAWLASTASTLQRIDLTSWNEPVEFMVDPDHPDYAAKELLVLLASADRVVALAGPRGESRTDDYRVALFQDGMRSTNDAPVSGTTWYTHLLPGAGGNEVVLQTHNVLLRYLIASNAVVLEDQISSLGGQQGFNFQAASGKLYHGSGLVYDPATLNTVGRLFVPNFGQALVAAAPEIDRAFYLWNGSLLAVDMATTNNLGEFFYSTLVSQKSVRDFLLWPGHGFAFVTDQAVQFVQTRLVSGKAADLEVTFSGPATVPHAQDLYLAEFEWIFEVTNHGPGAAPLAILALDLLGSTNLGTLQPGEVRQVVMHSGRYGFGIHHDRAQISSAAEDPISINNTAAAVTAVIPESGTNLMILPLVDIAVAPEGDLLYAALSTNSGALEPGIAVISPGERRVTQMLPLDGDPDQIEVSSDHRYIFARLGTNQIQRYDVSTDEADVPVAFANETILDFVPLPGEAGRVAVVTTQRLLVLDGEEILPAYVNRPNVTAGIGFASGQLWLAEPEALLSFEVTSTGIGQPASFTPFSAHGGRCDFVTDGRYLYFHSGAFDTLDRETSMVYSGLEAMHAVPDGSWFYSAGANSVSRRSVWPPTEEATEVLPFFGPFKDLVAWGEGGLAVLTMTDQKLWIFDSAVVPGAGSADLGVAISAPEKPFTLTPLEWRIAVTNHSSEEALRVKLTFDLPDSVTDLTVEGLGVEAVYQKGYVSFDRLPGHGSAEFFLRGIGAGGNTRIRGEVMSATSDPDSSNNVAETYVYVTEPTADVHLSSLIVPSQALVGEEFPVSVVVTNPSPHDIWPLSLIIPRVADSFDIVSVEAGNVYRDSESSFLLTPDHPLPAGSSVTIDVTFKLLRGGVVPIIVYLGGNFRNDPSTGQNQASRIVFGTPAEEDGYTTIPQTFLTWVGARNELLGANTEGTGRIFAVDPASLDLLWQIAVPGRPHALAVTSDGDFAWVGLVGGTAVRIDLAAKEVDLSVTVLNENGFFHGLGVVPNTPDVVLAITDPGSLGNPQVRAFRDGAMLPRTVAGRGNLFTTEDGRIFLLGNNTLRELQFQADGVVEIANYDHLAPWDSAKAHPVQSRIFFSSGDIADFDSNNLDGRFRATAPISVNLERGEMYDQVFEAVGDGVDLIIRAWNLETMDPKWSYRLPRHWDRSDIISLGTNGVILPLEPARVIRPDDFMPGSDLAISVHGPSHAAGTNIPIVLEVEVRNESQFAPRNADLQVDLSPGLQLMDAPSGSIPLGDFFDGTNLNLTISATTPGEHTMRIVAESEVPDPNSGNEVWEQTIHVAPLPTLFLEDMAVREGGQARFYLSAPATHPVEVEYWIEFVTADSADVYATNGTMFFQPGSRVSSVDFSEDDQVAESDELLRVHFASAHVHFLRRSIDVTILNNDVPSILSSNLSLDEGNSGNTEANLEVHLFGQLSVPIDIEYFVTGGTANAGEDFLQRSGVIRFGPNEDLRSLRIPIIGDEVYEADESLQVSLRAAPGVLLESDLLYEIMIRNDDSLPVVALGVGKVADGEGVAVWFETVPGVGYELQHRTNLTEGAWVPADVDLTYGEGGASGVVAPGFYRVVAEEAE